MEEIQKRLRLKNVYRTEVDMLNPNDGTIHRKNLSYRYVDSKKNIIAVNQVDVESVVSREREKKRQLETALNLAEQANNAKSEFLATVSHEIRTPMNVVLGLTDLAKSEIDNREVLLDYLNKIEVSGKHLLHLVNDVLDMSKIESGEFKLHPVRYNLKDFLMNMQNYVQTLCKQKNITLLIAAGKDFPDIFVRRAKQEREIGHSCIKGVFLDELDPDRGRMDEEIMPDCGIGCYLISREIIEEKLKGTI